MPIYDCRCCKYSTHIKTHYHKHLTTKKHKNSLKDKSQIPTYRMKLWSHLLKDNHVTIALKLLQQNRQCIAI